jgi:hypothetical protein
MSWEKRCSWAIFVTLLAALVILPRSVYESLHGVCPAIGHNEIVDACVGFKPARITKLEHVRCAGYVGSARMGTHCTVLTTGQHKNRVLSWLQPCKKLAPPCGHSREGKLASFAALQTRLQPSRPA